MARTVAAAASNADSINSGKRSERHMKRAYIRWHVRRYGHEPQWGNGDTIEQYRGWCAAWRACKRGSESEPEQHA